MTSDQLGVGQRVVGYTVREGTNVERFNGKRRDLIIVDASGSMIDQSGGIWFGMSGSPIYTIGGKLIGAVSYGFSSTSSIAGVTPANPDMLDVFDLGANSSSPAGGAADPRTVALSKAMRARIARRPGSPASADGSMSQLKIPLSISGLTAQHRATLRRDARKHHLPFFIPSAGGSSAPAGDNQFGQARAGESFAAALSYGDITMAGIGTTSYVCNGKALAFGHPFFFTGPNVLGASAASALGIVEDPVYGAYKLANVTDPLGVVDQDRLSALRAQLGRHIPTTRITQHTIAKDIGDARTGETDVVQGAKVDRQEKLPFIAFVHSFSNIDSVFDQISGGSSRMSWTIHGVKKPSGKRWSLTRANKWVSHNDISFTSAAELLTTLSELQQQHLARIAVTGVHIDAGVEQSIHELRLRKVLWSTNGHHYRHTRQLRVKPGSKLFARVKLRDSDQHRLKTVQLKLRIPRHASGYAQATVGAQGSHGAPPELCIFLGRCGDSGKAKSFNALLAQIQDAPRNDDLVAELRGVHGSSPVVRRQPKVIDGHETLVLKIGGGHHRHHASLPPGVATTTTTTGSP